MRISVSPIPLRGCGLSKRIEQLDGSVGSLVELALKAEAPLSPDTTYLARPTYSIRRFTDRRDWPQLF